ncbi:unnamed protein product [Darwinula stevensoni]|uniref:Uncharacterized protein n=1 Tax=Darwinula stevensoni TaxID=69355 RepID=A0A7R9A177_9CRUS|nr:unnamed protein product [Darwinula stevensoni]CAG0882900.1 unnamed protein product [Darwinula stevensoni]
MKVVTSFGYRDKFLFFSAKDVRIFVMVSDGIGDKTGNRLRMKDHKEYPATNAAKLHCEPRNIERGGADKKDQEGGGQGTTRSHIIIMRMGIKVPPIKYHRQNLSSNPARFQLKIPPSIPHSEVPEELELEERESNIEDETGGCYNVTPDQEEQDAQYAEGEAILSRPMEGIDPDKNHHEGMRQEQTTGLRWRCQRDQLPCGEWHLHTRMLLQPGAQQQGNGKQLEQHVNKRMLRMRQCGQIGDAVEFIGSN